MGLKLLKSPLPPFFKGRRVFGLGFSALLALLFFSPLALAKPLAIVAAENFYGQVAQEIGGQYVQVTSILTNPGQDPHLFSSSPSTAIAIANAQVIIYNGLGYDPWLENLISVRNNPQQKIINVSELIGKKLGDNPHIWYDPATMQVFAEFLTKQLAVLDPVHASDYQQQLASFRQRYSQFTDKIAQLRSHYRGTPVIATEPVFNYMADALGFVMHGEEFQLSIMNETEPTVTETKGFIDELVQHRVKLLIYNSQVSNPLTQRMQALAQEHGVAVFGVSETEPAGKDYVAWMLEQLNRLP